MLTMIAILLSSNQIISLQKILSQTEEYNPLDFSIISYLNLLRFLCSRIGPVEPYPLQNSSMYVLNKFRQEQRLANTSWIQTTLTNFEAKTSFFVLHFFSIIFPVIINLCIVYYSALITFPKYSNFLFFYR